MNTNYRSLLPGLLVLLLGGAGLTGCQLVGVSTNSTDIVAISSGQQFGFCVGYCFNELEITEGDQVLTTKGNAFAREPLEYPTVRNTWPIDASRWDSLLALVDTASFLRLDETYGCPDCADGGSEWLGILFESGQKKRVTYEYGKTVDGIGELIVYARKLRLDAIASSPEKNN